MRDLGPENMLEASQYRVLARVWEERAESEKDPEVRHRCDALADAYRLLAESLERRPYLADAVSLPGD
jgi:hypothetical protein